MPRGSFSTRPWLALLPLALLAACQQSGQRSITAVELNRHAAYLASDELGGRMTGTPEIAQAEEYIARTFQAAGLTPLPGREDYFLSFTAWRQGYDPEGTALAISTTGAIPSAATAPATVLGANAESSMPPAVLGADFRPFEFSGLGSLEAELVFAGYGITAPEHGWDDYKDLDVRGKVVLLLRYEPNENDPASPFAGANNTTHAFFATKVRNAQAHGAVGMLLFTTPTHPPQEDLRVWDAWRLHSEELTRRGGPRDPGAFLSLQLSQDYANAIAGLAGRTIHDLQQAVDSGTPPAQLSLPGLRVKASVARQGEPVPVQARDVVGYLPGRRTDQVVVVGAHHDHIGSFTSSSQADTIYNGADDNASGVVGVLELAQAFGRSARPPDRSMVFVTFSGEEQYLLGSQALMESGLLAPGSIAFMLNMDMIGRNPDSPVEVHGTTSAADLRAVVEAANRGIDLPLTYPAEMPASTSSDHANFRTHGIPVLFLHTGLHDDYHGLDDEADRLDYRHMERIVRLAWRVLEDRVGHAAP